jgi:hypothetical protein
MALPVDRQRRHVLIFPGHPPLWHNRSRHHAVGLDPAD